VLKSFDLHTHVIPPELINALVREPARFDVLGKPTENIKVVEKDGKLYFDRSHRLLEINRELYEIDAKIEAMDRMRIDVSVLSVAPPVYLYGAGAEAGLAAARIANDGIARMVEKHPARLRGMATLPMQDPDAAVGELERAVKEHGFKGVEIGSSIEGQQLALPRFRPVLKAMERLDVFLFAHPYDCAATGGMEGYELPNTIGNPLDETIMFANLAFTGALDDLPRLRILVAHGGGYLPYQIGRFERAHRYRPAARAATASSPSALLKRFYFDALTHDPLSTRLLIDRAGADHVVLGTDNPFDMGYYDPLEQLDAVPRLTAAEREQVCGGTAQMLLGEKSV
jgi:aminocarboxymuconate-semialdehyde decarboxylase